MGVCYITRREQREEVSEQLGVYCTGNDARPFGEVEIPNKVITLATRVFQNDKYVTKINLPPLLQEIQERAFENCVELQEIVFPDTLQTINKYAFDGCTKLIEIAVPDNIPLLKPYTFGGMNISQLVLKSSFSPKLWNYAYADNHSIKSIDVNCHSISKGCFSGSDIETVIIEGNTKILKERAFENCKNLINIQLNSDLLEIGDYCFYNTNLSKITIPKTIQRIGIYCFGVNDQNLPGLKEVTFQDGLKVISQYSFYGTALESVIIPSSIENIGKYAFGNCTKLVDIQLTDGIKQLGMFEGYAFANCNVERILIPPSVEKITKYCFSDCTKLTRVQFTTNIEKAKLEEGIFKNCTALNDVVLPEDMLYLGNNMFENCTSLESINLPKNLQELGDYCFKGCSKLASLNIPESIKRIGKYCFEDTSIGKIALPRTVTEIEGYAFSGCTSLGTVEFDYFDTIEEIPVEQGLQVIKSNAFYDSVVTNLNIPYTIQTIEKDAFKNMTINTLHIDVIKTQAWLDAVATWGMKSYKTILWRQSILNFDTNVPYFELFVSQNTSLTKTQVDTSASSYIFEPLNEGITLHYYAYAPNMVPIIDSQFFNRIDRENYRSFIFEEQAPYKIEFVIKNEDGNIINDAQVQSDTTFDDFSYTYQDAIYYVNKGTNISYTVLKTGYGAVYGNIEDVNENKIIEINLSKNGYVYIDLRYPYQESTEYLKYLLDNYNFKDEENFGEGTDYCMYSDTISAKGYIKFKTPDDIYAQNTIHIEGYITTLPSGNSTYNRCAVICSPDLIYPDVTRQELSLKQSNQQVVMNRCASNYSNSYVTDQLDRDGYGVATYSITTKLTNLKPNTIYYLLFKNYVHNYKSTSVDKGNIRGRWFIKRVTFNSCTIEDTSLVLPTIISGDKICLLDGMGKNELYINTDIFGTPPENSTVIFKKAFDVYPNGVQAEDEKHLASNCAANKLTKEGGIGYSGSGLFDSAIFQLVKPIDCNKYSKIKITCIIDNNYTNSNLSYVLTSRAYVYIGHIENIATPISKVQYNWSNWTEIGSMTGQSGKYSLAVCTLDLTPFKDESNELSEQDLFIGVYHGTETSSYTAQCYITEIELQ